VEKCPPLSPQEWRVEKWVEKWSLLPKRGGLATILATETPKRKFNKKSRKKYSFIVNETHFPKSQNCLNL